MKNEFIWNSCVFGKDNSIFHIKYEQILTIYFSSQRKTKINDDDMSNYSLEF